MNKTNAIKKLYAYLASLPVGGISDVSELQTPLADAWRGFAGSNKHGMDPDKLYGRMEEAEWEPPKLTFVIERHGGTVLGSTRAEKQQWTLDLDSQTATGGASGFRQLTPAAPRLNVKPMADEIAQLIVHRQEDDRIRWNKDGSVRVEIGKILPAGSTPKQTLAGRRRRFRKAVDEFLNNAGWQKVRTNVYTPGVDAN